MSVGVTKECLQAVKDSSNLTYKVSKRAQDKEPNYNKIDFKSFYVKKDSGTPYSDATSVLHVNDPEKIKRPMNAFMIYSHYERKKILQTHSDLDNAQVTKILGKNWKDLSSTEKLPFKQEAERLGQFHLIEYPNYRFKPRKKIKKASNLSFLSTNNPHFPCQPEKYSFKIRNSFGSNSWVNSPVLDLRTGSPPPRNLANLGIRVTIDSTFKEILKKSNQCKAKVATATATSTSSSYVPTSITSSLNKVQRSSFNCPPPPNVTQLHQRHLNHQWYEQKHIYCCQQQMEDHHTHYRFDQQQWDMQEIPNHGNTIFAKGNYLEDGLLVSPSPCSSMDIESFEDELSSLKEELIVDIESFEDELSSLKEELIVDIECFEDEHMNLQNLVPELSKLVNVIPYNILKKANELVLQERKETKCNLVMGDWVVDIDRTYSSVSECEHDSQVGTSENFIEDEAFSENQENSLKDSLVGKLSMSSPNTTPGNLEGSCIPVKNYRKTGRSFDRNLNYASKTFTKVFKIITDMTDRSNLPQTITGLTCKLFKTVWQDSKASKKLKGRSHTAIAAACLYITCRQKGLYITYKEIAATSTVSVKALRSLNQVLQKTASSIVENVKNLNILPETKP